MTCSQEDVKYPKEIDLTANLEAIYQQVQKEPEGEVELSCVSKLGPFFIDFFTTETTDLQVNRAWDCVAKAIVSFRKVVKGRTSGEYTKQEVKHFLTNFFFEREVSDDFITELMKFKSLFVRGGLDKVSKSEIEDIIALVNDRFRTMFLRLREHNRVLFTFKFKKDRKTTGVELEAAIKTLQEVLKELGQLISDGCVRKGSCKPSKGRDYELSSFNDFMGSFFEALEADNLEQKTQHYTSWVDNIKSLKAVLFGQQGSDKIGTGEWGHVFDFFVSTYGMFLYYYNFSEKLWLGSRINTAQIHSFLSNILNTLSGSLDKSDGVIKNETIFELKESFQNLAERVRKVPHEEGNFQCGIDVNADELFKKLWSLVINQLLKPPGEAGDKDGITLEKLNYIKEEVDGWYVTQNYLRGYVKFLRKKGVSGKDNQEFLKNIKKLSNEFKDDFDLSQVSGDNHPIAINEAKVKKNIEDIHNVLTSVKFRYALDDEWRLLLMRNDKVSGSATEDQEFISLGILNLERILMKLIFTAFDSTQDKFLDKEEIKRAVNERGIKQVLRALDLDDASIGQLTSSGILPMNIFLPNSDGKETVSFMEALEYNHYLFSFYNTANNILKKSEGVLSVGCHERTKQYDRREMEAFLLENFESFFSNLPGLANLFKNSHSLKQNIILYHTVHTVKGHPEGNDEPSRNYSFSDILGMSGVLHFAESFLLTYDNNWDGIIDFKESTAAYAIYRQLLTTEDREGFSAEETFHHLIAYGEIPIVAGIVKIGSHPLSGIRSYYISQARDIIVCSKKGRADCENEETAKLARETSKKLSGYHIRADRFRLLKILYFISRVKDAF